MPCPYCGAALDGGARLCRICGRLIAPTAPTTPTTPTTAGQSPPGERPVYPPGTSFRSDPYSPFFDLSSVPPETLAAWRQHRFQATFSVLLLILVHFLTFGLASPFLLARKYAFLPTIRPDDFSMLKAAGFLFIPFFAFYWVFVLCRRARGPAGLQARLWSLPGAPSRGLATALAVGWVLSAIPYVGILLWFPLHLALWPIYLAQVQRLLQPPRPRSRAARRPPRRCWRWSARRGCAGSAG